jgi:hypothetical protein
MTPYQYLSAQLIARSAEPQPVLPPRDYEPHCVFNERDHWDGADSMADWAIDQQPKDL